MLRLPARPAHSLPVALLVSLAIGCAAPRLGPLEPGWVAQIRVGETTEEDVVARLGLPQDEGVAGAYVVWTYEAYAPRLQMRGLGDVRVSYLEDHGYLLRLYFDDEGTVARYAYQGLGAYRIAPAPR
ncbi:MAG: hypothetical protein HYV08_04310 [Deltaproteobacteria bacterium]|nr:hypothetical protein [Deltaproteobacteria bacterium]MBI3075940.1 hypothetical protein [Deltaproteobacteria bacterium]